MTIMNTCARCGGALAVGELAVDVRDALAHLECPTTTGPTTEAGWRLVIAEQVRRNCTLDWETVKKGGDALVYAVADWIENPPDWSALPTTRADGSPL